MPEAPAVKVKLNDIVDALDVQFDEYLSLVDLDSGNVSTVSRDLLREAEACADDEAPYLPAWQEREWESARKIVFSNRFKRLPNKYEIHEWAIILKTAVDGRRSRQALDLPRFSTAAHLTKLVTTAVSANACDSRRRVFWREVNCRF